jgi:ABC-2 type transport system permease protein
VEDRSLSLTPTGDECLGDSWIEQNAMLMTVMWPLIIMAIFLPLAVRRYQRLSR